MANIFDQFDPPSAGVLGTKKAPNPFDQFDDLPPGFELEQPASGGMLGTATDVAKQGLYGLAEGAASIPGFVPRALGAIGHLVSNVTGLPEPEPIINRPLTPDEQLSAALPQPQTTGGEIARTAGSFLPGAYSSIRGVVAPALSAAGGAAGATVGGQAAPSLGLDPTAGTVAGAILGGGVGLRQGENLSNFFQRKAVAPAEQILDSARDTYNQLKAANRNLPIPQGGLSAFSDSLTSYIKRFGPSPENAAAAYKDLESLKNPTLGPGHADVSDLVRVRQNMKSYFGSKTDADAQNRAVAAMAIPELDNAINQISPDVMSQLREADANYSAGKTAQAVSAKIAKAEAGNEAAHSGLNLGNKIEQNINSLIASHTDAYGNIHGLNPADVEVLNAARTLTYPQKAGRYVSGVLGGGGGIGTLLAAGAGALGAGGANELGLSATEHDPIYSEFLLPGIGFLTRKGFNRSVARGARNAEAMIRARSPYAQALGQSGPQPLMSDWRTLGGVLGTLRPAIQQTF